MPQQPKQRHVMLSYQWKIQKLVLSIYDYLVEEQIPVWMDIKAGIPSDNLYEGIGEAIENSACFICFMTPEYQESDFCKQELQYAKQCNIPIIPLKLEENWNPTSWLGFITAGLLWLDFYHMKNFEKKATELYNRIFKTVGNQFQLQNSHESKPIEKKRVLRSQSPPAPRTYSYSKRIEPTKEVPTVRSYVSPNRRRSPTRKIPPSAYYGWLTKILSNNYDEEEEEEVRNDSKFHY